MANADVLTDDQVIVEETTKAEAEAMGALAFFGDKYGEQVRVVRAGAHSIELCGGTHVGALGMIGPITVVSEASIGSNTRRIEAVTGTSAFDRIVAREGLLAEAAALLRTEPEHVPEAIDRLLERQRATQKALDQARSRELQSEAGHWSATAVDGVVVARRDGLEPGPPAGPGPGRPGPAAGLRVVVLGGSPDGQRANVAVSAEAGGDGPGGRRRAGQAIAPLLGGGGGGSPEMAVAGGKDPSGIDRALERGPATPCPGLTGRDEGCSGAPGPGGGGRSGLPPHRDRGERLRRHRRPAPDDTGPLRRRRRRPAGGWST